MVLIRESYHTSSKDIRNQNVSLALFSSSLLTSFTPLYHYSTLFFFALLFHHTTIVHHNSPQHGKLDKFQCISFTSPAFLTSSISSNMIHSRCLHYCEPTLRGLSPSQTRHVCRKGNNEENESPHVFSSIPLQPPLTVLSLAATIE